LQTVARQRRGATEVLLEQGVEYPEHQRRTLAGTNEQVPVDGLERVREAVAVFDAESMSARCGAPAESIRQLARDFAAAERAVCYG
ncbi:hypothetical protein, partial [Pseudomonas aeruginosa]